MQQNVRLETDPVTFN